MATPAGIEPATFSLEGTCGCCSINAHSDKSTVLRAIEPKRLSATVRMKANDSTGQSFPSPSEHDMSTVSLPASIGIDFRQQHNALVEPSPDDARVPLQATCQSDDGTVCKAARFCCDFNGHSENSARLLLFDQWVSLGFRPRDDQSRRAWLASASESISRLFSWSFRMRFSVARYLFRASSSWSTVPVT
jgi:hypothetical protein